MISGNGEGGRSLLMNVMRFWDRGHGVNPVNPPIQPPSTKMAPR